MVLDATGTYLYVADSYCGSVRKVSTETGHVTTVSTVCRDSANECIIFGITIGAADNALYVSDYCGDEIRRADAVTGTVATWAGAYAFAYSPSSTPTEPITTEKEKSKSEKSKSYSEKSKDKGYPTYKESKAPKLVKTKAPTVEKTKTKETKAKAPKSEKAKAGKSSDESKGKGKPPRASETKKVSKVARAKSSSV